MTLIACVQMCRESAFIPSLEFMLNTSFINDCDNVSGIPWYESNTVHEIPIVIVTGPILMLLLFILSISRVFVYRYPAQLPLL